MAKKVKPGKLRGNTTPNLLTDDPNDFTLQLTGGMKYYEYEINERRINRPASLGNRDGSVECDSNQSRRE